MHAYAINLERRPDRRATLRAQLSKLNIDISWITAIDGKTPEFLHKYQEDIKRTANSPAEYACYLSHISAWHAFLRDLHPYAIILEDDVLLTPDFSEVIQELPPLLELAPVIRLGALQKQTGYTISIIKPHHRLILPTKNLSGAQGYLISRHGAQTLIERFGIINEPVDTSLDRYWHKLTPIAGISPPVISQNNESPSDISGFKRKDIRRNHRFLPRILHSLHKHLNIIYLLQRIYLSRYFVKK